jgi:hypothetical protein
MGEGAPQVALVIAVDLAPVPEHSLKAGLQQVLPGVPASG